MRFGDVIRQAREAKGLNQGDVATALGVSVAAVSQWENGGNMEGKRVPALAALLDLDETLLYRLTSGPANPDRPMKSGVLVGAGSSIPPESTEEMLQALRITNVIAAPSSQPLGEAALLLFRDGRLAMTVEMGWKALFDLEIQIQNMPRPSA